MTKHEPIVKRAAVAAGESQNSSKFFFYSNVCISNIAWIWVTSVTNVFIKNYLSCNILRELCSIWVSLHERIENGKFSRSNIALRISSLKWQWAGRTNSSQSWQSLGHKGDWRQQIRKCSRGRPLMDLGYYEGHTKSVDGGGIHRGIYGEGYAVLCPSVWWWWWFNQGIIQKNYNNKVIIMVQQIPTLWLIYYTGMNRGWKQNKMGCIKINTYWDAHSWDEIRSTR